jgi:hypothetical protein
MSQSATLYRLDEDGFSQILEDPEGTDIFSIAKEYSTFRKTHEALLFILSKNQDEQTVRSLKQLFYPETNNSKSDDFEKIKAGVIPKGFDFESFYKMMENILHYNTPEVVQEIATSLSKISENDFRNSFDYKELNSNGVYPGDVWNDEADDDSTFNMGYMIKEFAQLKNFYQAASDEGDYVLSFVG